MRTGNHIVGREIIDVVCRNKRRIIAVILVSFVVATVGSYVWPAKYGTEAKLLIKLGRENIPLPSGLSERALMVSKKEEDINSEIEILTNVFLISEVLKRMESDFRRQPTPTTFLGEIKQTLRIVVKRSKEAIENALAAVGLIDKITPFEKLLKKVQKNLKVKLVPLSDVISLKFTWKDPEVAVVFLRNLVSEYLDYHLKVLCNSKILDFFDSQVNLFKKKLDQSRKRLHKFKISHAFVEYGAEKSQLLKQLSLRSDIVQNLISEVEKAEAKVQILKSKLKDVPRDVVLSEEKQNNPIVLSNLKRQLADLIIEERELTSKYFNESSKVRTIRSQIELLKAQIDEEQKKSYGSVVKGINKNWLDLNMMLIEAETQSFALRAQLTAEQEAKKKLQTRLDDMRDIESQYLVLKQQEEIDRKNYLLYEEKMEQVRIEVAMDNDKLSSVRVIQPVRDPAVPLNTSRLLIILLSIVFGALGGVALSFFLETIGVSSFEGQENCAD